MNLDTRPLPEEDVQIHSPVNGVAKGVNAGEDEDEEGEGEEIEQGKAISDDSSEEEEEDEEAARRVREGFIVDEDEEEEGDDEEDDEEERRRSKKRRKHKHRHKHREPDEDEDLDEEDLELLEENTGGRIRSRHLTRLRRGRIVESSDDDLDEANIIGAQEIHDIQNIWDDDRAGGRDDDDEMDMDDFIDDEEDEEEGAGAMAEEEREERRRERRRLEKERRKALRNRPELTGIDASTWDEIHDVFGDGHDYDWALVDDEEEIMAEEAGKPEMKYQDVFEPSEIKARLLTEDDDLIRAQDYPERMQLGTSTLSSNASITFPEALTPAECVDAASWVTPRLGGAKERDFFKPNGKFHYLLEKLVGAVTRALEFLLVQFLEVPYIYAHRRDFISYFNPQDTHAPRVELLNQDDLWRIYALGQKFRSLCQRKKALQRIYENIDAHDEYYEGQLVPNMDSVEVVADVTQWLGTKYKDNKKKSTLVSPFRDEEEQAETRKHKLPSRMSAYEVAKKSIISRIAEGYGIKSHEIVVNFMSAGHNVHFVEDKDLSPAAFAEQYADPDPSKALPAEDLLRQARMIIATELGIDPLLRRHVRDTFKNHAQISILPTDRGKTKIDDHHVYYVFKYLYNKPIEEMLQSTQFLNILEAESQHLVTVTISLPSDVRQRLVNQLVEAFTSDSFSEMAKVWNEERALVVEDAVEKHLIPMGAKWVREFIREEVEDYLAKSCADALHERVNMAPYHPPDLHEGEQASVLAVSWGKGDPKRDEINLVFLDEAGRLREHSQIDNLLDSKNRDEFRDLVKRRRPDVVVIGGLSINTATLSHHVKMALNPHDIEILRPNESSFMDDVSNDQALNIPVIYVQDEVARLYQHSKRATEEFPHLPLVARYCVGLARYAQSPLNEFAALGGDLTAITFDDAVQPLIPTEKLLSAFERVLVDVVNKVGVDINRAVNDPYYATLLPYVAGLGPRKAQALIKKIVSLGGNLVNREQFVKSGILTMRIFLNAAGFLRIAQDPEYKEPKSRGGANADYSNYPDPLDDTRVHPEDYDLARKMATDALELDEEDVHDEHPSNVVGQIMKDSDNVRKLDELNLDDFAISMEETSGELKRHTLNVIRAELIRPFGELRPKFVLPEASEVLTMLTGETERTLRVGLIVSVLVIRLTEGFAVVKLDSGIEGIINGMYQSDDGTVSVKKGQTLPGVIIDVKSDLVKDQFSIELSSRPSDVAVGDAQFRRWKPDEYWNVTQAERDYDVQQRKKRAEVDRTRRVIKHPNFQNFNSAQAETFLDKQHPGDVVIRPSSKGLNHLAVTWKVADNLYQHIDVVEPNADPSGQTLGGQLIVDGKYEFADLDELIVNHVKAMSRRVEELMAHEKFKKDDDELQKFLISFVAANPNKSIYGFTLNRKKPGHFNLSFLPKKGSSIQTWPVRVAPEAYYLFDAAAAGVAELCNAFKVR
ncbi:transcription elongation factor SPT6 [Fomitiporia mediterranea MF3/22]|uniref:transcription elongation factor SPT6 n=1 Tax=Fomitiporia mediterranea (strain MF3/22) TaxID=694068 RepID=UPI000440793F|nr:transcription elongation factor SPT6 [Fomitiporia mediterranea MF3/22]EJD02347.1 transcription elongation factor SPT6 [Fomitiporia mediterranea MF3/22]